MSWVKMTGDVPKEMDGVAYVHRKRTREGDAGEEGLSSTCAPTTLDLFLAFGGATADGAMSNDVRAMDCATKRWVKLSTKGTKPSKRMGQAATLVNGRLFVHGGHVEGEREEYLSDAYELNLDTLTWREVKMAGSIPTPRAFHTIATLSSMLVCFGGDNGKGFLQEVFFKRFDDDEWHKPVVRTLPNKSNNPDASTKLEPSPRACHTATPLTDGDTMIVFGGIGLNNESQNDTWAWSAAQMTWAVVDPPSQEPEARFMHTTTVIGDGLAVLGGMTLNPLSQASKRTPYRIFSHMYILTAAGYLKHPNWHVTKDSLLKHIEASAAAATTTPPSAVAPKVVEVAALQGTDDGVADAPVTKAPPAPAPAKKKSAVAKSKPNGSASSMLPSTTKPKESVSKSVDPLTSFKENNPTSALSNGGGDASTTAPTSHGASAVPPKKKLSVAAKLHRMTSDSASMSLPRSTSKIKTDEKKGDETQAIETVVAKQVSTETKPKARQQKKKKPAAAAVVENAPAVAVATSPVEPVGTVDTVEPVEPDDTVDTVEPVELDDTVEPVEPVEPDDTVEPVEPVEPDDTVEPVGTVDTVEPDEPVGTVDTVEPDEPVDTVDPVDTVPGDPVDPVVAAAPKVVAKDLLPVPGVSLAPPDDDDMEDIDEDINIGVENRSRGDDNDDALVTGKSTPSPPVQLPAKSAQAVPIPGVRMAPMHDDEWDGHDSDERMPSVEMSSEDDERAEVSPSAQPIAWAKSDCGKYSIMIDRATGQEIRRIEAPPMSPPQSSAQRKRLASPSAFDEQPTPKTHRTRADDQAWTVKERLLAKKFFEQFELTDKPKRYRGLTEERCAAVLAESWNALPTLERVGWLERARGPLSASKASARGRASNDSDDEPTYTKHGDRAVMDTPTRADMEYAANLGEFRGNDLTMLGTRFSGVFTGSFDTGYFATVTMEERSDKEYRCVVYSPALASPADPTPAYCVPAAGDDTDVQNVVYKKDDGTHSIVRAREAWSRSYAAEQSGGIRQSSLEPID